MKLERRSLLGIGLGAATLALGARSSALGQAPAPAAKPGALKLGLATFSVRKLSTDKVLELCKSADIKYVTLKDVHLPTTDSPEELQKTMARFKEAGITVLGGGVVNTRKADEAGVRKSFEYAKAAGLPLMVMAPTREQLDLIEKLVKEFDLPIAIHNHGPGDKFFATPLDALNLIKKRDKRMGVCMDIGHTFRAGGDIVKSALACGPRLLDLHVKDITDKTDEKSHALVGRGIIDIVPLFKALHRMKFKGHVALEYEDTPDDPAAGVRESLAYMRGVAAGVGAA
jgi:sugar phosphate isomerase/epimerase